MQEMRDAETADAAGNEDGENEDEDAVSEEEENDQKAFLSLPKEYFEHFYQPLDGLEGKKDLENGAHADEWHDMAEAGVRRFVASVRAYCIEVGNGLEEQENVLMICKLAQQVVKQMDLFKQDDSMDILKYVKVKRVPGGEMRDSKCYWVVVSTYFFLFSPQKLGKMNPFLTTLPSHNHGSVENGCISNMSVSEIILGPNFPLNP